MPTIRYNEGPNRILAIGDHRIRGGESQEVSKKEAKSCQDDPNVDVTIVTEPEPVAGAGEGQTNNEVDNA